MAAGFAAGRNEVARLVMRAGIDVMGTDARKGS